MNETELKAKVRERTAEQRAQWHIESLKQEVADMRRAIVVATNNAYDAGFRAGHEVGRKEAA